MVDKPTTADEVQRQEQTRAAREQSGLPPERPAEEGEPPRRDDQGEAGAAETDTSANHSDRG